MKLLRADETGLTFHLAAREKSLLLETIQLYPLVPGSHHRLSKTGAGEHHDENQHLLEAALAGQRRENRRPVMAGCAAPAPGRKETWVTPEFIAAYARLHAQGHAHSVECWQGEELVGGIYGVSLGGFFAGESMFHRVTNASKIALWHLAEHLRERGFALFDIQMVTPATRPFGAVEIPRPEYLKRLRAAVELDCAF